MRTRNLRIVAATLLVSVMTGCTAAGTRTSTTSGAKPESPDYAKGYQLGLDAYTYGLPLLVTNATFQTMTSPNVSVGAYGPVNQFNSVRSLNNPGSKAVVAPGSTGLSSIAWLDLSAGPQVLHVPEVTSHFFNIALVDPYTENLTNFGTAASTKPGDYVITGPGQKDAQIPAGTTRVDVDYPRIWVIGSTQLKGPSDVAAVNKIQDQYTLTPLSKYGTAYSPPQASKPDTTVIQYSVPTGLQFFDELGQQLKLFPPPAADAPELAKLAEVGIGPGMTPSTDSKLSSETVRGLTDAVAAGPALIKKDTQALFAEGFDKHNGYLLGGFGRYGTDYRKRAVITAIGLGAVVPQQTIYAMSWSDHDMNPLSGSTPYVLHMASMPPTNEGWSLTLYNLQGALIQNSIGRYAFSPASNLTKNADGSVDIYLQSAEPTSSAQAANWLPTASGQGFEVTWRLIGPQPNEVNGILGGSGWQPPAIQPAQ